MWDLNAIVPPWLPWVPEVFSCMSAPGWQILRLKAEVTSRNSQEKTFCMGHYKDLTETGNCAWKVSGTQGIHGWCINIVGGRSQGGNTICHFRVPPGLCIKMRFSAQPLIWKWFFILMQINLIFPRKAVHLASFWKQGFLELGGGLFCCCEPCFTCNYLKG